MRRSSDQLDPIILQNSAHAPLIAGPITGRRRRLGLTLGLLGVLSFSLSLPMTRVAVGQMNPWLVALGRCLLASGPAGIYLLWIRPPLPTSPQRKLLARVVLGVIIGFPVCSSIGMQTVPATHGAVVIGLLPLTTALFAAWLGGERPSRLFWCCAVAGSSVVALFSWRSGGGNIVGGDLWLLLAVILGALGYSEGGRLAREIGGPQVICWALVLSAPFLVIPVTWLAMRQPWPLTLPVVGAFAYLTLVSQLLGFFAWYRGLAEGGVARIGQVQLLQVFLTIAFSASFFGEEVNNSIWIYAALVVALVAGGRVAGLRRKVANDWEKS